MRTAILVVLAGLAGGLAMRLPCACAFGDNDPPMLTPVVSRLEVGKSVKIVCLGDSVTGVYYHTGGRRAYPEMVEIALRKLYPQAKVAVVNAGISGNSTRNGLARLERDVLDQKPDLVTVMFGLNDMVGVPVEEYRTNLKTIAERCREQGADVLFCTPNAIYDDGARTTAKLVEYCGAMKEVATEHGVPVCDCYGAHVAARERDAAAWRLMMSDAIHPNMEGHKLNAVAIARSISGRETSLDSVDPPQPAIPRTLKRLKEKEPLRVLAMTPLDGVLEKGLRAVAPDAHIEMTKWPTEGKTLQQLEAEAKEVRGKPIDLVVIAVPLRITPGDNPPERDLASLIWTLNWSLSFGRQEWDVIVVTPSVVVADLGSSGQKAEEFTRRMVRAQDLSALIRKGDDRRMADEIVAEWLRTQLEADRGNDSD